jgi:hypothetical protein
MLSRSSTLITVSQLNTLVCISQVWFGWFMVFNATFNNISVISWRSVLLLEETEVPGEHHDLPQVTDKLYHIMLYTTPWSRFELTTSVVIGNDCIGSCKSNCHTIMATMAPLKNNISLYACKTQIDVQPSDPCLISTTQTSVPQIFVLFQILKSASNSQIYGNFSLSQIEVTDICPNQ